MVSSSLLTSLEFRRLLCHQQENNAAKLLLAFNGEILSNGLFGIVSYLITNALSRPISRFTPSIKANVIIFTLLRILGFNVANELPPPAGCAWRRGIPTAAGTLGSADAPAWRTAPT